MKHRDAFALPVVLALAAACNQPSVETECVAGPACHGVDAGVLACTTFSVSSACEDFFYTEGTSGPRLECGCTPDVTPCQSKVEAFFCGDGGTRLEAGGDAAHEGG